MSDDLFRLLDVEARLQALEHKVVEEEAKMVIFRSEVARNLERLDARLRNIEIEHRRLNAVDEQIRHRTHRAMLVDVLTEASRKLAGLPQRVDTLERCLAEIEVRLKIRRRPKELPPGGR